jgi:putative oxidoreductase
MKIAISIARVLLALIYLTFGLDYFLDFIAHIVSLPSAGNRADAFFGALSEVKYFFPFLKSIEIICGLFLLINRFTAFFLVAVFPITVNICVFHACVAHTYLPLGASMLALNLFLLYAYRKYYSVVFTFKPVI